MVDCDPAELGRNRPLELGPAPPHRPHAATGASRGAAAELAARVRGVAADGQEEGGPMRRSGSWRSGSRTACPSATTGSATRSRRVVDAQTTVVGDGGDVVGCASKIVLAPAPGAVARPGAFRLPGRGPVLRHRGQAAAPGRARAADRRRRRLRTRTAWRWRRPCASTCPMTVVIGNDGGWGQIRNPQLASSAPSARWRPRCPSRASTGWWRRSGAKGCR